MDNKRFTMGIIVFITAIIVYVMILSLRRCNASEYRMFKGYLLSEYIPLIKNYSLATWNASITGAAEDWQKVQIIEKKINDFVTNTKNYTYLDTIYTAKILEDPEEARELELLHLLFKANRGDKKLLDEISDLSNDIQRRFNIYRTKWNGKQLTDNEVQEILKNTTDSKILKEVWTAQKEIGNEVNYDLIRLVKLRNIRAKGLGYDNYHTMSLKLSEQNPDEINHLFDWLYQQTNSAYEMYKRGIDKRLAERFHIDVNDLKPWHYQDLFFQGLPAMYHMDFDNYYKKANLEKITSEFYRSIDLPIDELLLKSDLYSKPGKSQHAFCIKIDEGDTRVLSNNMNNQEWMNTMLHEFGHATYSKYISTKLPYLLQGEAHILTTEAVAELFGRGSTNPNFMKHFGLIDSNTAQNLANSKELRLNMILEKVILCRWILVMYNFEKSLYANPDQDLNNLWWETVEKYQLIKRPDNRDEPDWAAKIHFTMAPCYYHNYLLGELLASQLNYYIVTKVLKEKELIHPDFYGKKEVGEYLKTKFYAPGALYKWDKLIKDATGDQLLTWYYMNEISIVLNETATQ